MIVVPICCLAIYGNYQITVPLNPDFYFECPTHTCTTAANGHSSHGRACGLGLRVWVSGSGVYRDPLGKGNYRELPRATAQTLLAQIAHQFRLQGLMALVPPTRLSAPHPAQTSECSPGIPISLNYVIENPYYDNMRCQPCTCGLMGSRGGDMKTIRAVITDFHFRTCLLHYICAPGNRG